MKTSGHGAPPLLRISTYHPIVAEVANVAGHASNRRTEPYWNAVPDNPAADGSGNAHIGGCSGYCDASLGGEILASHGGRSEHGDRDQSRRQELDCSHRTCLCLDETATLVRFFKLGQLKKHALE